MLKQILTGQTLGKAMISALLTWMLSAFLLCLLCSALLNWGAIPARALGYCSSAISFLAAAAAGAAVARRGGNILNCLITALALLILLLTLGYLISSKALSASGILSASSFTLSGCVLGFVLSGKGESGARGKRPGSKRRFKLRVV